MASHLTRRQVLRQTLGSAAVSWAGPVAFALADKPSGGVPPIVVIEGKPRERGRAYGCRFHDGIKAFLDREIYGPFLGGAAKRDEILAYAGACGKAIRQTCPLIHDEMEGMAEGAGLQFEEIVLITLHEELYHRGVLPKVAHCTAVAVGPPETSVGRTYVAQTWDWMESVAGLSQMLEWRRTEGPSVLAYAYPGLWIGAGLNRAGVALCWTSAGLGDHALGARVGLPSYVFLAHLLYQDSLDAAIEEARRDRHAGWFTFVIGDAAGNLVNIEGSPAGIAIECAQGRLTRIGFGSKAMTTKSDGSSIEPHPRCLKMASLLDGTKTNTDLKMLQDFFEKPECEISVGKATIDMMVFDTAERQAYLSRGPSYQVDWKPFCFGTA